MDLSGMHEKQQEVVVQDCGFDSIMRPIWAQSENNALGTELEVS